MKTLLLFVLTILFSINFIFSDLNHCIEKVQDFRNEAKISPYNQIQQSMKSTFFIPTEIELNYDNSITDFLLNNKISPKQVCLGLIEIFSKIESDSTLLKSLVVVEPNDITNENVTDLVRVTNEFFRKWFEGLIAQTRENYLLDKFYSNNSILVDASTKILPFKPTFRDISYNTYAVIPPGSLRQGLKFIEPISDNLISSKNSDKFRVFLYTGVYSMTGLDYTTEIITVIFKRDDTIPLGLKWMLTHITAKTDILTPLMATILSQVDAFNLWYKNRLEGTD